MRVTRESLIRIAKELAQERAFNDGNLVAAYLTGSLLLDSDPLLGGTTDIDVVLVHAEKPAISREIVKLTTDFHLDIHHRTKSDFKSPREMRTDPLLGYEMYDPQLLYEREKFFEFVQAGLRAGSEFHAPSLVLGRCRRLLAAARKGWMDINDVSSEKAGALQVKQFLRALTYAGNTIAELSGAPLAERRFLLDFPERAHTADLPDCTAAMFNLLGASQVDPAILSGWLPVWKTDFLAAAEISKVDQSINTARLNYYEKGMRALLEGDSPLTALWPLIQTWTLAAAVLDEGRTAAWHGACEKLGLLGTGFNERISAFDNFQDDIEVRLDELASANGLEKSSSI